MGMAGLWRHRGSRSGRLRFKPKRETTLLGLGFAFPCDPAGLGGLRARRRRQTESGSSRSRPIVFMGAMQCRAHIFSAIRAIIFCFWL